MGIQPSTPFYQKRFFAFNPIMLCSRMNAIGQQITFYQHPTLGDQLPIFVTIHDADENALYLFQTMFYEVDQMITGDIHEPVLSEGLMWTKHDLALI